MVKKIIVSCISSLLFFGMGFLVLHAWNYSQPGTINHGDLITLTGWNNLVESLVWQKINTSDIVFPGRVGIGLSSSLSTLGVKSQGDGHGLFVQANSNTNTVARLVQNNVDDGKLYLYSNGIINVDINSNGNSYLNGGNFGIGVSSPAEKLEVNGGIKLGITISSCDSSHKGVMKFSGDSFYGCNGSEWIDFALGTGSVSTVLLGEGSTNPGSSCNDILTNSGNRGNKSYWIDPDGSGGSSPFEVFCDMTYDGGGWTLMSAYKRLGSTIVPSNVSKGTLIYDPYTNGVSGTNRYIDLSSMSATKIRYDCKNDGYNRVVQIGQGSLVTSIKSNPMGTRPSTFTTWEWGDNNTAPTTNSVVGTAVYDGFQAPFGRYGPDRGIRFNGSNDSCATGGEGSSPYNRNGYWTIWLK